MNAADRRTLRALRRSRTLATAEGRQTWRGAATRLPNRRAEASRTACRSWRYEA